MTYTKEEAKIYREKNRDKLLSNKKEYYQRNKEILKKKSKEYYSRNKSHYRDWTLRYKYNINNEDYLSLYKKQEGKCEICKERKDVLLIDHNHATGKIRGLLCDDCNKGLGRFKDNIEILNLAIKYLNEEFENAD